MCKDNDFSPQITRINTDYFIEKWSQNETGTFRNKKTGKKKVFYPDIGVFLYFLLCSIFKIETD